MRKILIASVLALIIALSAVSAFGFDRDPYDMMGFKGLGIFMGLGLAAILFAAVLFVFWVIMLIDCLKRDFKKDAEKIAWILVLIFLHILGAIIYYFVVKVSSKQNQKEKKK